MEERKVLNGTFDLAMRLLAILATCKTTMTVERLSIYAYFAVYLSDLDEGETSLHPAIPYRNTSLINSRDVVLTALDFLLSKGVVNCDFTSRSVKFGVTELGDVLYTQLDGWYKEHLEANIKKAHKLMMQKSDRTLNKLVYGKMADWGSEFSYESVLKEIEYDE